MSIVWYFLTDDYNVDENVQKIKATLFNVASRRDSSVIYCVDTSIGRCECPQGINGSTCWHQFLPWSNFKESSFNFLPVNDSGEKKRLTEIAIGSSLEPHFYDSIHCFPSDKRALERTDAELNKMSDVSEVA